MNTTIFNLNYKISIIIISILGILIVFLSNGFYINGVLGFIFYILRGFLYVGIFALLYVLEKRNLEFKSSIKNMIGYLSMMTACNIVFSIFIATNLLKSLFVTLSGVICFWGILSFVLEILNVLIDNKIVKNISIFNKKIGLVFANPICKFVERTITND